MIPAVSYRDICNHVARLYFGDYGQETPPGPGKKVKMVGLLFARPSLPLAQAEVTPNLDYFHYRSGSHIDFFCAGYDGYTGRDEADEFIPVVVDKKNSLDWRFSEKMFIQLVDEIEAMSSWRYSGDPDLILTNAHYDATNREAYLDFGQRVQCRLQQMKDIGAIISVPSFIEDIIRYADHADEEDPTWGFSDAQVPDALRRFVLAILPQSLSKEAERLKHFAVVG